MRSVNLGSGAWVLALHAACCVTWGDLLSLDPNCSIYKMGIVADGRISVVES